MAIILKLLEILKVFLQVSHCLITRISCTYYSVFTDCSIFHYWLFFSLSYFDLFPWSYVIVLVFIPLVSFVCVDVVYLIFVEYEGYGDEQKEDSDRESSPEFPVFDRAQLLEKYKVYRLSILPLYCTIIMLCIILYNLLCYIISCYSILCHIISYCIIVYYIVLCYIILSMLYYFSLYCLLYLLFCTYYIELYHIMLYYSILCYILLYYILSYYATLCYIISYILCYSILYYIIVYYFIFYYIILYYFIL